MEGMAALLEASLLQSDEPGAETRFQLLETIREFALERLIASGEATTTLDRHARYFRDLAERTGLKTWETGTPALYDSIEREHDDWRAVARWPNLGRTTRVEGIALVKFSRDCG